MNKKAFIPIVLLILLIAVMGSGSFALYTQTQTLRGQLYMRIFLFAGAEKTTSYEFGLGGLTLSPGESEKELYRFTLTNAQSNGNVCDYDMSVTVASSGMAAATAAMSGLTFSLYDVNMEGSAPVATASNGELSFNNLSFSAGVNKTVDYRITAYWADNGDTSAQTAVGASAQQFPIRIYVTAYGSN